MIDAGRRSASIFGAPGYLCRMTIMSGAMAIRFSAVSISVSPFSTEEPEAEKFSVSAERRFSAISKDTRVRVEASMNRLMTSCPRSAGTFFTGRSLTSLKPSAVSRMRVISSEASVSMPSRSFDFSEEVCVRMLPVAGSRLPELYRQLVTGNLFLHDQHFVLPIQLRHANLDDFVGI